MGGIPTDLNGRVVFDDKGTIVEGLYAAGECACVSVHGANRLGTNSLVDLIVFGRRAGLHIHQFVKEADFSPIPQDASERIISRLSKLKEPKKSPPIDTIRERMKNLMMEKVGIYRNGKGMSQAVEELKELRELHKQVRCGDASQSFNTAVLEILELGHLLDNAYITAACALNREESRGAHAREDFPERDDPNWLKHSLAWLEDDHARIGYKPVDVSRWEPKPRKY